MMYHRERAVQSSKIKSLPPLSPRSLFEGMQMQVKMRNLQDRLFPLFFHAVAASSLHVKNSR